MANQVIRWSLTLSAPFLILVSASYSASGVNATHLPDYPDVTVEHAELLPGPSGIPDTAYLTIYNGTGSPVSVTQVTARGYGSVAVVKRSLHLFGYEEVVAEDADLIIPAKSELEMGQDSVFITMDKDGETPDTVTITIGFDNGDLRSFPLQINDTDSPKTSHHHGLPKLE